MKKILPFLILFLIPSVWAVSISCSECSLEECKCSSDCSYGLLDIYTKKCEGTPNYELTIISGMVKWQPSEEGIYHGKILCDNGETSKCERIEVPSSLTYGENYFPYILGLTVIFLLGFLIYRYFAK